MTRTELRADALEGPLVGIGWGRFRTLPGQEDFDPLASKRNAAKVPPQSIHSWLGVEADHGVARVPVSNALSHSGGILFGGVSIALLAASARSLQPRRRLDSLSVRFLRPVVGSAALARATTVLNGSEARSTTAAEIRDASGALLVHALAGGSVRE